MNKEMEQLAQKIRNDSNQDIKRHIGALFEEFDGRMLAVKEYHNGQFEKIQKTLDSHTEILEHHTKILDSHTEMIGDLAMEMSEVKEELKNKVSIS